MNVDRLQERVIQAVVLIGGLLFAVFCGTLAGGGQYNRLGTIMVGLGLIALVLTLKARIWLLVPLFWPLGGVIPLMDWPFSVRDLSVLVVFASFLILMGFKVVRAKPSFDLIDFFVLINIAYLGSVFVRNPVGFRAFDSDMVGGKPYFNVFIACLAYYILSRAPVDVRTISRLPFYLLPAPAFVAVGTLITTYSPALAGKLGLGLIYSEFASNPNTAIGEDRLGRKAGLANFGQTGMQVLTSYFRPLTLLFPANFWRFTLAVVFMVATLLSGFRSVFLNIGVFIVFSTIIRRRFQDLLVFAIVGIVGVTVLALGNGTVFDLPLAAQRTLSFLPGNWDEDASADARASVDWRVDMWRMVWNEDRWIRNRWLGDGFGFTRRELSMMEVVAEGGEGFIGGTQQEAFMINGVFHNGPLSTIRYVGAFGLALYYGMMVVLALRAVKLVKNTRDSSLFPAAIFVGMPIILYALTYPIGMGQFDFDMPQHIFMAGLIKMVTRAVEEQSKERESALIPPLNADQGILAATTQGPVSR